MMVQNDVSRIRRVVCEIHVLKVSHVFCETFAFNFFQTKLVQSDVSRIRRIVCEKHVLKVSRVFCKTFPSNLFSNKVGA